MELSQQYPIHINSPERDIIKNLAIYQERKIPSIWEQLVDQKDPVRMSSYELGFMTSLIADHRHKVPEVWKQLMNMLNKFREDGGVKMTELGNGIVQLKDKDGTIIIREKYEWEK